MNPHSLVSAENIAVLTDLATSSVDGCFVEVGVYRGGTAVHLQRIAKEQGRSFFAYDTFEGIPFAGEGDFHSVGDFSASFEDVKKVLPYATVVKGIFPESAVPMPPVAFAHIDCDQYKSIYDSALYLRDKMSPGGIMLFDDYGMRYMPKATQAVEDLFGDQVEVLSNGKGIVRF